MYTLKLKVDGRVLKFTQKWKSPKTARRAARAWNQYKGISAEVVQINDEENEDKNHRSEKEVLDYAKK